MATRRRKGRQTEEDTAKQFYEKKVDQDSFEVRILPVKGRAVFSTTYLEKGQFLLEYGGELISEEEARTKEEQDDNNPMIYRYFFNFQGKCLCYDASNEKQNGPKLGRLVNHGYRKEINAKMKMLVTDKRQPILCLFAIKDIKPGNEILYDYGQNNYPWENEVGNAATCKENMEQFTSEESGGKHMEKSLTEKEKKEISTAEYDAHSDLKHEKSRKRKIPSGEKEVLPKKRKEETLNDENDGDSGKESLFEDGKTDHEENEDTWSEDGQNLTQYVVSEFTNRKREDGKDQSKVYVKIVHKGKRVYDKSNSCFFCQKEFRKLARHLENVHADKEEVKNALDFKPEDKKRQQQFEKLCRMGNFNHNVKVKELGEGELKVVRRPSENIDTKPKQLFTM